MRDAAAAELLVVDAEAGIRRFLARSPGRPGWVVAHAANPSEAMDLLDQRAPTLLLTDLHRSSRQWVGLALVNDARVARRGVRVVVLTGHDDPSEAGGRALGVRGLRSKPFDLRTLIDTRGGA